MSDVPCWRSTRLGASDATDRWAVLPRPTKHFAARRRVPGLDEKQESCGHHPNGAGPFGSKGVLLPKPGRIGIDLAAWTELHSSQTFEKRWV